MVICEQICIPPNDYAVIWNPVVLQNSGCCTKWSRSLRYNCCLMPTRWPVRADSGGYPAEWAAMYLLKVSKCKVNDIDHLGNRHYPCRWWINANQFRIGLARMERNVRERRFKITKSWLPQQESSIFAYNHWLFKGASVLTSCLQFMDQHNPLSGYITWHRLSALETWWFWRDCADAWSSWRALHALRSYVSNWNTWRT